MPGRASLNKMEVPATRRAVSVRGIVQGVGFRPFVYELACRFGLTGFVRNQSGRVLIEIEGDSSALDGFIDELVRRPPPLARIDEVIWASREASGERTFTIEPSEELSGDAVFISPDIATCDQCLAELLDPADRRFRYPLINCTNCGPRFTIIVAAPYDRQRTSMAGFAMCRECRTEYEDPSSRRFHAQPIACPNCGPRLAALDANGEPILTEDPIAWAAAALAGGLIGAVKGLGGYHLACNATSEAAVATLRERKQRDAKAFAVMVADLAAARKLCDVSAGEATLLKSPARPVVLLRRMPAAAVAAAVAPGNPYLGIMLPYSPLHHLLLGALDGIPLVMTSDNARDEPITYDDGEALQRLRGTADFLLTHNRPIHMRCDDSVMRIVAGCELPLRRSRGNAPEPIALPVACVRPTLALGGALKVTFALGRDRHAFLSHHLGDLDQYAAYQSYVDAIEHYQRLFAIEPQVFVHDLHPDYQSTRYGLGRCRRDSLESEAAALMPHRHEQNENWRMENAKCKMTEGDDGERRLLAVQHHHAHMASCLAEHGLDEPAIGVIFDGSGFGHDGAIWGGEFLVGDYREVRRAAHLRYVPLPGGEQAVREPWRMAVSYATDAGVDCPPLGGDVPPQAIAIVRRMISQRFNAHLTSSVGRLFDGVAALAGMRNRVRYEGEAAMELEWRAAVVAPDGTYPFDLVQTANGAHSAPWQIDTRRLISAIAEDVRRGRAAGLIGRRFHSTLVEMISQICGRIQKQTGLEVVVLSGGVFMNALLLSETVIRLTGENFRVYRHARVPPNDGGLCLGQLAIAAAAQSCEKTLFEQGRQDPARA